jgi:pSer/pThr/pTyr-binding forkhead associated (FHA) protein
MDDQQFREMPTPEPIPRSELPGEEPSRFDRLLDHWKVIAGLALVGLIIAVVSAVLVLRAGTGSGEPTVELPPSLQELAEEYPELAGLVGDPSLGSVYKEFLVVMESGGVAAAKELAAERGLLNDRNEIRVTLVLDDAQYVPLLVEELRQTGITVEGSYREMINVGVPMELIDQLAADQGAQALFAQLTQREHIIRLELPAMRRVDARLLDGLQGEGVPITGADQWHAAGYRGQSVRVGVLDLGFDGYRRLLGTELPAEVVVASFIYGKDIDQSGEVHGTACAEIVHEMAPDAELFLAAYDSTLVSMGQAVDWLLSQGVHIISNSTTGVVGPMDGSDESARMVDDAASAGVLWVNSAGNAAQEHYRGIFVDEDANGLHEFPDGTEAMGVQIRGSELMVALNWDDWGQVTEDYDLFLFDDQGDLVASSEDTQSGQPGQSAAEAVLGTDIAAGTYYVSIKAHNTSRAATFDLYAPAAAIEFPVAEHSLGSPADAYGALAVGATEYRDDSLASYSSQGPSNDGRLKPDLSAPAGVSGETYGAQAFDGTSASTPHVAGAAALVWSAFASYNGGQIRDYLQANALDLGPPGPDNGYGFGRLLLPPAPDSADGPLETETATPAPDVTPLPLPTLPSLPTAIPLPTIVPEPTVVSLLPEPEGPAEEGFSAGFSISLTGVAGVLGALLAVGGGGLLLAALLRSRRRAASAATAYSPIGSIAWPTDPGILAAAPEPYRPAESGHDYGRLVGAGNRPMVLRGGRITIGRSSDNDIVINSLLVSRRHAVLECSAGRCTVEDLGSANGLYVNGQRVSRTALSQGARLRFGDVTLTYLAAGAPLPGAWLEVGGHRHPVSPLGTSIGRSRDNDLHIGDERASRHHARVELQQGQFVITDLGSANGTLVNGRRVQRHVLESGDEIVVGGSRLVFRG